MKKLLTWALTTIFTFSIIALFALPVVSADIASTRDEAGEYVGRTFDEEFDAVLDEITTEDGYLRAKYTNKLGITPDDAIFKSCSGINELGVYQYLVFKLRGTDGAKLADLKLAFRKADGLPLVYTNFADLLDPDQDAFKDLDKELSSEYQIYVINLNDSLDGLYYDDAETIAADNKFLGFHLMAGTADGISGTLEIAEVYYSNDPLTEGFVANSNNALIDKFDRADVNLIPSGIYWCGSVCGQTVYSSSIITSSNSYTLNCLANSYTHLVLRLCGDVGGEEVKVSINDTEVKLSELHDAADKFLPAVGKGYVNYVIDLALNNLPVNFTELKVATETGIVYLDKVFGTNMEINVEKPSYPNLDKDILMYDDFSRPTLGAYSEYLAENEIAQANGFDYLISYAGLERISIQNGALVFDNTGNPINYFNYKSNASTRANNGSYPYLVFKVKVSDGGSLDNFRFQTLEDDAPKGGIVWSHSLFSAKNLKIASIGQEGYAYITEDGWTYIIVDLAVTGMSTKPSGLDLYWGGVGKLYIGSIFYAKDRQPVLDEKTEITFDDFNREQLVASENQWWIDQAGCVIEDNALKITATGGYAYFRGAAKQGFQNADAIHPYLVLTMKGVDGADLNTLRIEGISSDTPHVWVNSGKIILADGRALKVDALTSEYQTFVIDLVASGFNPKMEGLGVGYDGDGAVGSLYIDTIKFANSLPYEYTLPETTIVFDDFNREQLVASENEWWIDQSGCAIEDGALKVVQTGGYAYFRGAAKQGFQNADAIYPYLAVTMKALDGADLSFVRIEGISSDTPHIWVNSGKIILADGTSLKVDALTGEYQTLVIDLVASGFNPKMEGLGFGFDGDGAVGSIYIDKIAFVDSKPLISDVETNAKEVAVLDLTTPVVKINGKSLDISEVTGALSYEVYQGSTKVATLKKGETLSFDIATLNLGLGSHPFTVIALGNGVTINNSGISDVVNYELSVSQIAIKTAGKVSFENGEAFATGNLEVEKVLSDGTKVTLTSSDYTIDSSAFQKDVEGKYTIIVKLNNSTLTVNYEVSVAAPKTQTSSCSLFGAATYQLLLAVISISLVAFFLRKKR